MPDVAYDIAFDCDGTLTDTPDNGYINAVQVDIMPVLLAHERGLTVAVMTCSPLDYVAALLVTAGLSVVMDSQMAMKWRPAGLHPGDVVVTNRKVMARVYPDDKAVRFRYGDDPAVIFAALAEQS